MTEIFLFVCISGSTAGTPNFMCQMHKMADAKACAEAVSSMKIAPATDDKGNRVFAYCAPKGEMKRW